MGDLVFIPQFFFIILLLDKIGSFVLMIAPFYLYYTSLGTIWYSFSTLEYPLHNIK